MGTIYRSYEVLIEETSRYHKTRAAGKTKKDFKPHFENTCRALEVTHDLFQDAACYYIICLIGLVKDQCNENGEPINRMWEYLLDNAGTNTVLERLASRYPNAPFHKVTNIHDFLLKTYGWTLDKSKKPTPDSLLLTYRLLFQQAVKASDGKDKSDSLENLKTFASNWIAIMCNEDGNTTIPGQGVFDKLHRQLSTITSFESDAVWEVVEHFAKEALQEKTAMDEDWKHRESIKINIANAKAKKQKAAKDVSQLCSRAFNAKLQKDREALKALFKNAFSPQKTQKYCSLCPDAIQSAIQNIEAASIDDVRFIRLRYGARDNSIEQPLFRFIWLRQDANHGETVTKDLLEYVKKEKPESELRDVNNQPISKMPYQITGKEPLFPYFTNCLGIEHSDRAALFEFDKSAFKRAAEEMFKYKIRSDEREEQICKRRTKITALDGCGRWEDDKGKVKQIGGIEGDKVRPRLMRELLDELGGAIGYAMRRATIGGWGNLRQEFLKIAKNGEPIDEDKLIAAIEKARDASGGGFGSGAFFKALCQEEYHSLWLSEWDNKKAYHPKNFVRWWVLYNEAKEELAKVWDDEKNAQKPIAFTWPSTVNRHGETSFRPLDFDISVTPAPRIDLFDCEGNGNPFKLVQTNAKPPKQCKSRKAKSTEIPSLTDSDGNALYPLTLSYRRLKRDRITNAEGSSVEAEYVAPLIVDKFPKFPRKENDKAKPLDSSASLLPADKFGCWHLMFSLKLENEMQKLLVDNTAKIPGEKSVRIIKKSGKWVGLNLRWPIDAKTENTPKKADVTAIASDGDEIEETDAKFSVKKIWCSDEFKLFDVLSVDLGVRYAGAWCRGHVKIGHDAARPNERVISPFGHEQEIVFDAYDFGTFRLQGEDAKIWQKDKHRGFGDKPELEKCGSRGRIATDSERLEFIKLAAEVFSDLPEGKRQWKATDIFEQIAETINKATPRLPIPSKEELKFFPDLGDHLIYRLRRRLGRIRFLFKLRWQISGNTKRVGHEYQIITDDELKTFRGEQRFNAIKTLTFIPKEDEPKETEDDFMRCLRLELVPDRLWSKLVYEHEGETYPLFAKVKTKEAKEKSKQRKAAQKAAWAKLRTELQSDSNSGWNWTALSKAVEAEIENAMKAFAGEQSLISKVARFVWPLQDKKWKWNSITKDGKISQSSLERDKTSREPKRFIHGMRGLSMKRIRSMQDFRQCCQSLAKIERRFYTEKNSGLEPSPVRTGDSVHEPAPVFLDKINELREQRVNQTAHMILAEALGLELMNPSEVEIDGKSKPQLKSERDLHGRYKQKKPRVAAIVLEDLSRYRTSQDRSRYENSQLMEWSHRAIIAKLQDMAQVFNVQIITMDASFSSRFCSRTGVPGIRCAQVTKGFESQYPWKKWVEEKDERAKLIKTTAEMLNKCDDPKFTLVLPMDGGPSFLPVISHNPDKEVLQDNADIGAAINIGLRSVAHPDRLDIFPVLRTEAKADGKLEIKNRRGSLTEAVKTASEDRTVQPVECAATNKVVGNEEADVTEDSVGDEELESGKFPYLYAAVRVGDRLSVPIDDKHRYQLPLTFNGQTVNTTNEQSVSAAQGKDYWSRVKVLCWARLKRINADRLRSLGIEPPAEWIRREDQ